MSDAFEILGQSIVDELEDDDDSEDSTEVRPGSEHALSADAALAGALATLEIARHRKNRDQIAAAEALVYASHMESDEASRWLSQADHDARCRTVREATKRAAREALEAPNEVQKQAKVRAWKEVCALVCGDRGGEPILGAAAPESTALVPVAPPAEPSFFAKLRGAPTWAWFLTGVGVATTLLVAYLTRRRR